jgi:hypothetical protein
MDIGVLQTGAQNAHTQQSLKMIMNTYWTTQEQYFVSDAEILQKSKFNKDKVPNLKEVFL